MANLAPSTAAPEATQRHERAFKLTNIRMTVEEG
jgi:hypothetical protein